MQDKPLVSVIIPAYNHEHFIKETILSIVNQSYGYENIELLVVDDCSTDGTGKILEELSHKYFFYFAQNEENIGVVKNMNKLIRLAKGKYIAGCASDDYWHHEKLEKQVALLEKLDKEYALCHANAYVINENGRIIFYQDKGQDFAGNIFPKILTENKIVAPSMMFRKEIFDTIGYYDEDISFEDRDMWIRAGLKYKFVHIDEFLVYRRHHPGNLSRDMKSWNEVFNKLFVKYRKYYEQYGLVDEFNYMMFTHLSASDYKSSIKHLWRIRNLKILFRRSTVLAVLKLFIPVGLQTKQSWLNFKRRLNRW